MTNLQKRIVDLQTKASEVELLAGLELEKAIQQLQRQTPDRLFLLREAEKCRHFATAVADHELMADLQKLAAELEETARRPR
jgi:hypothetical protein